MPKEKLLITIPAYNEEKTLGAVLKEIHSEMKKAGYDYEIHVIDDGSADRTSEVAVSGGAKVISHPVNLGLAESFRTEMQHALKSDADIIVHTDADGQYKASEIAKLVEPIVKRQADLVLGSRFRGKIQSMPFLKRFGNRAFSRVISKITMVRISDAQTGFRAFRKALAHIDIISNFTYTQEQIIKAARRKYRIMEVPIYFAVRGANTKSRLMKNPIDFAMKAGINLLRIYRDYRPLWFFGAIGFFFIAIGLLLGAWIIYTIAATGSAGGIPRVILAGVSLMIGVQILLFGFLADMNAR